jgi:hypothetical protein
MNVTLVKPSEMKITITSTQLMITELLLAIVRCLYNRLPEAKLLHADIKTDERIHDSVNTNLYLDGTFAVAITRYVKVDLKFHTFYAKSKGFRDDEWYMENAIFVSNKDSCKQFEIQIQFDTNGKMYINHENADDLRAMIGNPKA